MTKKKQERQEAETLTKGVENDAPEKRKEPKEAKIYANSICPHCGAQLSIGLKIREIFNFLSQLTVAGALALPREEGDQGSGPDD